MLVIDDESLVALQNMLQFFHFSETCITAVRLCSKHIRQQTCLILNALLTYNGNNVAILSP